MHHILKSFLKRLTNLSGTNRSLVLLRLSKEQDLDLHALDFNNGFASFEIIRQLVAGKNKIVLGNVTDSRSGKVNEISQQLRKIQRRDRFVHEERGAKELYVGWPFVRGKLMDDTSVRCPLLFFPVVLEQENDKWLLRAREGEEITFNKNFLLAYSTFNKVTVSDELLDTSFEDWDTDMTAFRTSLYNLLNLSIVNLNFNQDLFADELKSFTEFTRDTFDENYQKGTLKLFPEAVLGMFPQAGSYLVPDYEEMLENPGFADLEEFFVSRTIQSDRHEAGNFTFLNKVKEEQTFTPFPLDASQENALKAVKKGNSLVVQGPPGTGKSQLISNLIADYIARGKKVLLVCQKRAALDVVHSRLSEKELAPFVGLVHDFRTDRQQIYDQVLTQIEKLEEYKSSNNSLDALYLERLFLSASRQIDQITEELGQFKAALFDAKECGVSVKELYLTSSPLKPSVDLGDVYKYFPPSVIAEFSIKFKNWLYYAFKYKNPEYPWKDRKSFSAFTVTDQKKLIELIERINGFKNVLSQKFSGLLTKPLDQEQCERFLSLEDKVHELLRLVEDEEVYSNFRHILNVNFNEKEPEEFQRLIAASYKSPGPEITLPAVKLEEYQSLVMKTRETRKSGLKWFFWKFTSGEKKRIEDLFGNNNLQLVLPDFDILIAKINNRIALEKHVSQLKSKPWVNEFPANFQAENIERWFVKMRQAAEAKRIFLQFRSIRDRVDVTALSSEELKYLLLEILRICHQVQEEKVTWAVYFSEEQILKIQEEKNFATQLKETLKKDFEELVEFDSLESSLQPHEIETMQTLFSAGNSKDLQEYADLFSNSIKLRWIEHIELKFPVLKSVTGKKMEQTDQQLINAVAEKLRISNEIAVLRARERTYKYIDYNRLNNMVTYRDLKHQVSKKRKIWPLRKLIAEFYDELFELVPCWMASPESVSAIFPMKQLFDLVIFDEASQCFAEKGIPAMYRANQVVITGDEMQLSPSELYSTRFEDENDDSPELEADSLLNLAGRYLMQVQLQGHYRSKSLELIQFSNQHFYGNNLRLLPDYNYLVKNENVIDYIKTDGVWEKNTNRKEAEKVCDIVFDLIKKFPGESIGVVTFNYNQQMLIQDLLEEKFTENKLSAPDSLFVKNIENVQGDERDHIIFSIGYAPDSKGRMIMNFGSLNLPKGENRLNVAVTRARNKVHLICSILPDQLNTENSVHEGPRLLKKYLQYALEVSQGKFNVKPAENKNYSVDWLLKNRLKIVQSTGLATVAEELPYADLTIKAGDKYTGLILTDDNLYLHSISVKDAHAYTPVSLAGKEWKFQRFWSRQYWMNAEAVKEQIQKLFFI